MPNRLKERAAIVTGAASGLGLAFAEALAGEGAQVALADWNEEAGRLAAEKIQKAGGEAFFQKTDVSKSPDAQALAEKTLERFGRIDILINNAGVQHISPIHEFAEEQWDRLLGVILTGTFLSTKYVLPAMRKQKRGRIINISSALGQVGTEYKCAYVAAKHGVIGFTKATALEGAPFNITSVAVCPSYVRTPLMEKQIADQAAHHGIPESEVIEKIMLAPAPLKRLLEPSEVAEFILFLTSDAARGITGSAVAIDCGWTSQ